METAHEMGGLFLSLSFGEELTASLLETVAKVNRSHNVSLMDWLLAVSYWLLAYRNRRSYLSNRISNL